MARNDLKKNREIPMPNKSLAILLLALSLTAVSCASISYTNPDNSLLLVLTDRSSLQKSDLFVYYSIKGPDFSFKIDPMKKFQQINLMKPGEYQTTDVQSTYIRSGKKGNSFSHRSNFELVPNTVSIYPYKVTLELKPNSKGGTSQHINLTRLTAAELEECEQYIASQPRYEGLAVLRPK